METTDEEEMDGYNHRTLKNKQAVIYIRSRIERY